MAKILVQEVPCLTANELLQKLSPLDENFNLQEQDGTWLFRGHGKEEWELTPSLFRKDPFAKETLRLFTKRNTDNFSELLLVERDLLVRFFEIADKRGLIIPDDSQELRTFFEKLKSSDVNVSRGDYQWRIKERALSLMALAQHYGVPTRLLDWTKQAYVAAFFAAEKVSELLENKNAEPSERLAVWAFYFPDFGKQDEDSRKYGPLSIVTAPKATNTNLKAQQGVFTLLNSMWLGDFSSKKYEEFLYARESKSEIEYLMDIKNGYPHLDEILGKLAQMEEKIPYPDDMKPKLIKLISDCKFQKFTLPVSEAASLLYSLSIFDITPTTIYPGYHSIVSDMRNKKTGGNNSYA